VLLTTGAVDVLPDIAGARERWGRDFLHCPYCHGWEVRDQSLAVLATVPESVEYTHLLRQWSGDVTFFTHTVATTDAERATLESRDITVVDGTVESLVVADDRLRGVELSDGRIVPVAAVFIRPALRAHPQDMGGTLGCERTDEGLLRVDAGGRTSVPGVWAAGNAANPRAQVITAAGEGSAVAIAINTDLVRQDVEQGGSHDQRQPARA
jgi:thioredoxin reductase